MAIMTTVPFKIVAVKSDYSREILCSGYFRVSDVSTDLAKIRRGEDHGLVGRMCFYPIPPDLQKCPLMALDKYGREVI